MMSNTVPFCLLYHHRAHERTTADLEAVFSVISKLPFFRQFPRDRVEAMCMSLEYSKMPAGRVGTCD